ncbi:MAG TPA: hypothetical protein VK358_04155 [Longimicrobium sp.]|nr:hypothetical protein [Longimicrobium sp.]
MKSLALITLCTLGWATPVFAQEAGSPSADAARAVSSVQLVIWNRAEQPIDVEVRLGEEQAFFDQLRAGSVATSIEAGRILQRTPGTYVLQVIDRTRNLEDSVTVQIGSSGQNVGVHLTRSGLAFVLTRGDVTDLTPPPSALASR